MVIACDTNDALPRAMLFFLTLGLQKHSFIILLLISCFVTHFLFVLFMSGLEVRIKGPD